MKFTEFIFLIVPCRRSAVGRVGVMQWEGCKFNSSASRVNMHLIFDILRTLVAMSGCLSYFCLTILNQSEPITLTSEINKDFSYTAMITVTYQQKENHQQLVKISNERIMK